MAKRFDRPSRWYAVAVPSEGWDWLRRRWQLTPDPVSAGAARRLIRSACEDWAVDSATCDSALVVVTELVTNVVEHAGTQCELTASVSGEELRIEVRDFHRSRPRPRLARTWSARGQGLRIVASLSSQWGVTEFDDGKSLWAVLPMTSPPQAP
jgi:serine/threonine-protein kinase RsbW